MAIAREAVVQISDFTEQNLSNTCWAFAARLAMKLWTTDDGQAWFKNEIPTSLPCYTHQKLSVL